MRANYATSRDARLAPRLLLRAAMLKTLSCLLFLSLSAPAIAGTIATPVVGGTAVRPGEWPDVALVAAPTALCTGTLIAPDVVLTAGHCIGIHPEVVMLGTVDYGKPGGEVIKVKSATAYPDWQHQYDVGVIVLDHAAAEQPQAVAGECSARGLVSGAAVRVVGFGLTTKSGTGENTKLNEGTMHVQDAACTDDPACQVNVAPDGEFTAGGMGTDSCFGDSGGPLFLDADHTPALIGVVSRGLAVPGTPCGNGGVYVRADKVIPWVEKVTGRKIARTTCGGKADDGGDAPAELGGCSVGGEALGGGVLLAVGALWLLTMMPRRRRR